MVVLCIIVSVLLAWSIWITDYVMKLSATLNSMSEAFILTLLRSGDEIMRDVVERAGREDLIERVQNNIGEN